jgi:hypothetical protein
MLASRSPLRVSCGLKENVAKLKPIDGVARVVVRGAGIEIPNKEGKKASVAIYQHLSQKHDGKLGKAAALEGLELYAEVVEDARSRPGAHPNIDLLFQVVESGAVYDIEVERA